MYTDEHNLYQYTNLVTLSLATHFSTYSEKKMKRVLLELVWMQFIANKRLCSTVYMVLFVDTDNTTRSQNVKADWKMFGVTSSAH
jgi:hypothetical protein